jgi:PAS domain S-box-containing protein
MSVPTALVAQTYRRGEAVVESDSGPFSLPKFDPGVAKLLDSLPFYAMLLDERHRILLVNQATAKAVGKPAQELAGKYCPKEIHGLSGPFPGCPLEDAVTSGAPVEREFHDEQHGAWVRSAVYPSDLHTPGGRRVFVHMTHDITAQKRAEAEVERRTRAATITARLLQSALKSEELDAILNQTIAELVAVPWQTLAPRGAIFLVEAESNVLVLKAQHGLAAPLLTACARVPFGHCLCGRAAQTGEQVYADHLDERHETRYDGILGHGHHCIPIRSSDRRVLGVLNLYTREGQARDAHEETLLIGIADILAGVILRRQAEGELDHYRRHLEELVEQRTAELQTASRQFAESDRQRRELFDLAVMHDVGTPLTVMQGYLEMLNEGLLGELNDEQRDALRTVTEHLHELSSVRGRMLEASGLDSGSIVLSPELVDVRALVQSQLAAVARFAHDRGVVFSLDLNPVTTECDPARMKQALDNFLTSALKYVPTGRSLEVGLRALGEEFEFRIRDHVREAARPEPVMTDADARLRYATGIELALARAIIEAHHGSIFVDAKDPQNTAIGFRIPMRGIPGELRFRDRTTENTENTEEPENRRSQKAEY